MADTFRFLKDLYDGYSAHKVYSASGIQTGQMMQWDAVARVAVPMNTTSGAIFLGVSEESQPLVGLGTPTVPLTGNMIRIKAGGTAAMLTTTGETYAHLDPVFVQSSDALAMTVTKSGASRVVGRVWLPDGSTVTGGTGTTVPVAMLGSQVMHSCIPTSDPAAR
jgi:hypothetical protein